MSVVYPGPNRKLLFEFRPRTEYSDLRRFVPRAPTAECCGHLGGVEQWPVS